MNPLKKYILQGDNPGALYSRSRLERVRGLRFSKSELDNFYKENEVLRQFYGSSNLPLKKVVRNATASYPLDRIHIDLAEFTQKHGKSLHRYVLFAVDNFSRFAFAVTLKTKQGEEMRRAAEILLNKLRPHRVLRLNQKSTFLSDLVSIYFRGERYNGK